MWNGIDTFPTPCYTSTVGRASSHDIGQTREAIKTKEIPPRLQTMEERG